MRLIWTLLLLAFTISGCSKSQPASDQSASPKAATINVDAATAGTISGVISFKGIAPKMKPLDMTQDPGCPRSPQPAEVVVANNGKLANVFVYVKEGLPQGSFAVPTEPVVLDQKGCRYNPHMLGIMAGQPLKITNTDTADHNIHDMPSKNPAFNESQMPTDKPSHQDLCHAGDDDSGAVQPASVDAGVYQRDDKPVFRRQRAGRKL